MKRIIAFAAVLAFTVPTVTAQNSNQTAEAGVTVDAKRMFASKVSELEAAVQRNSSDAIQTAYLELSRMMQKSINDVQETIGDAAPDQKADIKDRIARMNTLLGETKVLFGNKKNTELVAKMREFQHNL